MERCEKCGAKIRDAGSGTPTGGRVCTGCADVTNGAAVGMLSGGGLGGALAGPGILRWMRKALHKRRPDERSEQPAAQPAEPEGDAKA